MHWACKQGINSLVDRCVRNGYPLEILLSSNFDEIKHRPTPINVTIAHDQRQTFNHLLSLGAHLVPTDRKVLKKLGRGWNDAHLGPLIENLCNPKSPAVSDAVRQGMPLLLRDFLASGRLGDLPRHYRSTGLMLMLQAEVHRPHVLELTRLFLIAGADPNFTSHDNRLGIPGTPLVLALLLHAEPIWDLLLSHGAEIDGPAPEGQMAAHVPLCAAVECMVAGKGAEAWEWCIRRGANINVVGICCRPWKRHTSLRRIGTVCWIRGRRRGRYNERDERDSLLNYYLEWLTWEQLDDDVKGRAFIEGVALLLRCGLPTRPILIPELQIDRWIGRQPWREDDIKNIWLPRHTVFRSPVAQLLRSEGYGIDSKHLTNARFIELIKILARDLPDEAMMHILANYDAFDHGGWFVNVEWTVESMEARWRKENPGVEEAWLQIIDVVISNAQSQDELSAALGHYVFFRAVRAGVANPHDQARLINSCITRATIRRLVEAEADINYRRTFEDGRSFTTAECVCQLRAELRAARIRSYYWMDPAVFSAGGVIAIEGIGRLLLFLANTFDLEVDLGLPLLNSNPPTLSEDVLVALKRSTRRFVEKTSASRVGQVLTASERRVA